MSGRCYHILYVSRATWPMSRDQLIALVDQAERKNGRYAVTGILLYGGGNIIQLLEGPRDAVSTLYRRIAKDIRHRDVTTMIDADAAERIFDRWHMGLVMLDEAPELDCARLLTTLEDARRQAPGPAARARASALALLREFRTQLAARPAA
jgi:hypothetical protein